MTLTWDTTAVMRLLERATPAVESRLKKEALITANRIAMEAKRRVPVLSGLTQQGIEVEELTEGVGYAVVARRHPMPALPGWIQHGTLHQDGVDFFDASGRLEEGPHRRRMIEALTDELDGPGS